MDTPFRDGEDGTMLDVMANEDDPGTDSGLNLESLSADIHRALAQLPEREREVLQALFGIGTRELSLEEIGDKYGLTRERVRQIKEKALRHIKLEHSRTLKTYLG